MFEKLAVYFSYMTLCKLDGDEFTELAYKE